MTTETRVLHRYQAYGNWYHHYGSSMDPHICGDPDEPCETVTEQREVSDWITTERVVRP